MHSKGWAHRTIRLDNFFLNQDFELLLSGLSHACPIKEVDHTGLTTKTNMPPEIIMGKEVTAEMIDCFALACCLFGMRTALKPFEIANPTDDQYYKMIAKGRYKKFWEEHANQYPEGLIVRDDFRDLINRSF